MPRCRTWARSFSAGNKRRPPHKQNATRDITIHQWSKRMTKTMPPIHRARLGPAPIRPAAKTTERSDHVERRRLAALTDPKSARPSRRRAIPLIRSCGGCALLRQWAAFAYSGKARSKSAARSKRLRDRSRRDAYPASARLPTRRTPAKQLR
jgi:hypothetical protein